MTSVAWRTRGVLIFVLILLVLAGFATAGLASEQSPMVIMIGVEGNKAVPADEILSAVKATQIGTELNLDSIRADQNAIFNLGYFSEVLPPEFRRVLGGIKVVFKVIEYPPLKEITLKGLTKMPIPEAVPVFSTKPGEVINRNTIAKDLRSLFDKAQADYGLLLKSPTQKINPDGTVEIDLIEMKLRNLSLIGLDKTRETVVRREISAKEGEIFDSKTFTKDLQNLFMLGYFEAVDPKVVETGETDQLDLQVEFTEAKTGTVSLSLSYNTGDGDITGGFKIGDSNLFGTGNRLSFGLEMNPDKRNFDLSFSDPWLDTKRTSLTLHLYSKFDNTVEAQQDGVTTQGYWAEETIKGWEVSLGRPLAKNLTASIAGKHELLDRQEKDGTTVDPPLYDKNLPYLTGGMLETNSLSLQLEYKDLTPQKAKYVYVADGIKSRLSAEYAGGMLGGDTTYARYQIESSFFKSVSPRDVFALRLMGGYLDRTNDPMHTADFVIGGAETLRGYDYRTFSTAEMALANLEFRHRFTDSVEGVVFYDAFKSWEDTGATASGYGAGLRFWVPYLGQLRFDYGRPADDGNWQFYFSIGEVF